MILYGMLHIIFKHADFRNMSMLIGRIDMPGDKPPEFVVHFKVDGAIALASGKGGTSEARRHGG